MLYLQSNVSMVKRCPQEGLSIWVCSKKKIILYETSEEAIYKTVSLLLVLGGTMEQIFMQGISGHMKKKTTTGNSQHGLPNGKFINKIDSGHSTSLLLMPN